MRARHLLWHGDASSQGTEAGGGSQSLPAILQEAGHCIGIGDAGQVVAPPQVVAAVSMPGLWPGPVQLAGRQTVSGGAG